MKNPKKPVLPLCRGLRRRGGRVGEKGEHTHAALGRVLRMGAFVTEAELERLLRPRNNTIPVSLRITGCSLENDGGGPRTESRRPVGSDLQLDQGAGCCWEK